MGFQNILKLLKSDRQNLNYRHSKLKPLRCSNWFCLNFVFLFGMCSVSSDPLERDSVNKDVLTLGLVGMFVFLPTPKPHPHPHMHRSS